ncbi:uncharacterized protein (DUF2252 family) [Kribbella orskensis]|uniref:Uncharacterized protein (DUF2252 family) n=1 Tax=Kribbella orskensis TaxID=2512216 RepID=A0ABY2BEN5_9ACTN|nr:MULTISPECIES: DUF2252 domain-containing protein [Kribbella]TCN36677.1 uncharacterized protein (DUF2252 family) [Kribbella sp. VKM Ac-2500]TCO17916.1 uncharacterized protein (DUF2252 family) [Kribbella orskensis]
MTARSAIAETLTAVSAPRRADANGGPVTPVRHLSPSERARRGLAARVALPPRRQAELVLPAKRPDPVALIEEQARSRVPELVPVRHGRMMVSPFTFFRGNALGMATDLGAGPVSGLGAQLCGDAHLSNFGLFGSAERRLLFDINDFDESIAGPWEWDVKRLAASVAVAGRGNGFSRKERHKCVLETVRRYRDATAEFATMRSLDVWYARADVDEVQETLRNKMSSSRRKSLDQATLKARGSGNLKSFAKLTEITDDGMRIRADPPLMIPIADLLPDVGREELETQLKGLLIRYRRSLPTERQVLFDQFEFVDLARKVVGVGSVGTRCWIVLLRGRDDGDPLFLEVKEAGPSVLKTKVPMALRQRSAPRNEGERVVVGQRLMQASSDIFLGWQRVGGIDGRLRDFYVRQLRDLKGSAVVERQDPRSMMMYGQLCGWTLARAHARTGDRIALATYLNSDDAFPDAMVEYAEAYADQNESDYQAFLDAIDSGRLQAEPGL